jgi:hypothetical protein
MPETLESSTSDGCANAATWKRRHEEEHAVAKQLVADTLNDLMVGSEWPVVGGSRSKDTVAGVAPALARLL